MVGFVIGLGDRHLSNVMVKDETGDIVHIDFGDCFEVALARDIYPEHVPFRLTRQLVNVMEINGPANFRFACQHAMKIMRGNYRSMTAMLETLVHDPVLGLAGHRIVDIIHSKLVGRHVVDDQIIPVDNQVSNLIKQAQSSENMSKMFFGWNPFW